MSANMRQILHQNNKNNKKKPDEKHQAFKNSFFT